MRDRKNVLIHLISLCVLLTGFLVCRYAFLSLHNMHQWPMILFVAGLIVLVISFFAKAKLVPVFTSLAYLVGFAAGVIFQSDGVDTGGGRTNNLWIIWTVVFVCFVVSAVINEMLSGKRRNKD